MINVAWTLRCELKTACWLTAEYCVISRKISSARRFVTQPQRKILVWVIIKDNQSLWIGESRNQNPISVVRFYSLSLLYPYVPPICHSDRYFWFKLVQTRFLSNKNTFFALKFRKKFLVVVHWQINNEIFRWKTATQRTDSKSDYIPRQRKIQGKLKKRTADQVMADMDCGHGSQNTCPLICPL